MLYIQKDSAEAGEFYRAPTPQIIEKLKLSIT